jgi:hypothetical protein
VIGSVECFDQVNEDRPGIFLMLFSGLESSFDHEEGIGAAFSWHAAILGLNSNFFQVR